MFMIEGIKMAYYCFMLLAIYTVFLRERVQYKIFDKMTLHITRERKLNQHTIQIISKHPKNKTQSFFFLIVKQ